MVFIVMRFALAGKSGFDEGVVHGQQQQADDHALDRKPDQQRDGRYQDETDEAAKNRVKILRMMLRLLDPVNKSADSADQRQDEVDGLRQVSGPGDEAFHEGRTIIVAVHRISRQGTSFNCAMSVNRIPPMLIVKPVISPLTRIVLPTRPARS